MEKKFIKVEQTGLKLITADGNEIKIKRKPIFIEEKKQVLNNKKIKNIKIKKIINEYEEILWCLEKLIEDYKEVYNKTELFENKTPLDYETKEWNTIRKAKNRLARYYNELKKIYERKKNDKC